MYHLIWGLGTDTLSFFNISLDCQCMFSMYHLSLRLIVLELYINSLVPLYIPFTIVLPFVFGVHVLFSLSLSLFFFQNFCSHWDLNLEPPTNPPIPLPLELGLKGKVLHVLLETFYNVEGLVG